jgi:hypothetical protein
MKSLVSNWSFMRLIRLVLSIIILVQAFSVHDTAMILAGIFLLGMTLANVGCCGVNSCTAPMPKNKTVKEETISYEEIH